MDQQPKQTLAEFYNDLCKRNTGWEYSDWEQVYAARLEQGIRRREITRERIYDAETADRISRVFGLDAHDFETIITPVHVLRLENRGYEPPVSESGKIANQAAGYRIKQEVFERVLSGK